jgi:hypothetical protein
MGRILRTQRHETGHFVFGELDLFAAERGHRQVGHAKITAFGNGMDDMVLL